jgi:hypothetical protein
VLDLENAKTVQENILQVRSSEGVLYFGTCRFLRVKCMTNALHCDLDTF